MLQVGDRIQNKGNGSAQNQFKFGKVTTVYIEYGIKYEDGNVGSGEERHYKLVERGNKTIMQKVSTMFKLLVNDDTKALKEAGYINGDLELTDEGNNELRAILFAANKAELVKVAKDKLAEEAKNQGK
jgi:hypothetical protein